MVGEHAQWGLPGGRREVPRVALLALFTSAPAASSATTIARWLLPLTFISAAKIAEWLLLLAFISAVHPPLSALFTYEPRRLFAGADPAHHRAARPDRCPPRPSRWASPT